MGKPPGFTDGPYISPNVDHEEDMAKTGGSPRVARGIFIAVIIAFVALFLLVAVGLHIPTGG